MPALAVQLTVVLALPVTVALNCCVPPVVTVAVEGLTAEIAAAAETATEAIADWAGSATDVAMTMADAEAEDGTATAAAWIVAFPAPRFVATEHVTVNVCAADAAEYWIWTTPSAELEAVPVKAVELV